MGQALEIIGILLGVLLGLLGGALGGYKLGERYRGRPAWYWSLNAAAVVVCVAIDLVGRLLGQYWIEISALGLMAGTITGLKYGYSESIGIWKMFDSWTGGDSELHPPAEKREPQDRSGS